MEEKCRKENAIKNSIESNFFTKEFSTHHQTKGVPTAPGQSKWALICSDRVETRLLDGLIEFTKLQKQFSLRVEIFCIENSACFCVFEESLVLFVGH